LCDYKNGTLNKKVFVVIVTYNGAKWIEKCISSVFNSSYSVEIIVVDNHSQDNSVQLLNKFPQIHLILSQENLGFGKANNLGIECALSQNANYVFLLNQDTWVFEETIRNLVQVAEENPHFGIVSPMHFSGDEITLDNSFKTYYNRKTEVYNDAVTVPFVNAAAWLLSRECIEKVRFFEPLYSHYGEDRNYCDRVLYHDFKIVIAENSKICHDRIVTRSFNKDILQSKFSILSQVLNVNKPLIKSYLSGLKSVFGLPKYFNPSYGFFKVLKMFFKLLFYYIAIVFSISTMIQKRQSFK
jgi:GT2 family glycosyltransferase